MNNEITTIRTDEILLRKIVMTDVDDIFKGLSDSRVNKYYGVRLHTMEDARNQMNWYESESQVWWTIYSSNGNTFYGAGGLIEINNGKAEIGLWLLPEYWGQGIMKSAMALITRYGFQKLSLNRIEGYVETENVNCINAMSKLDYVREATLENHEIKDGKSVNLELYVKSIA
ncbi:MAG: GNAT family N-acetyltransferase [Lewinella sp.]